tara:strand:+ start:227 stop:520 length:294 start_codon:yes stop_codon:yes gene_type:complete
MKSNTTYTTATVVERGRRRRNAKDTITAAKTKFCFSDSRIKNCRTRGKHTKSNVDRPRISNTKTSEDSLEANSIEANIPAFNENIPPPENIGVLLYS